MLLFRTQGNLACIIASFFSFEGESGRGKRAFQHDALQSVGHTCHVFFLQAVVSIFGVEWCLMHHSNHFLFQCLGETANTFSPHMSGGFSPHLGLAPLDPKTPMHPGHGGPTTRLWDSMWPLGQWSAPPIARENSTRASTRPGAFRASLRVRSDRTLRTKLLGLGRNPLNVLGARWFT